MISLNGLHQLHIFIFFLAVFHVVYSAITMMLGRLKVIEITVKASDDLLVPPVLLLMGRFR